MRHYGQIDMWLTLTLRTPELVLKSPTDSPELFYTIILWLSARQGEKSLNLLIVNYIVFK
jgi:hypothetical protein